MKRAIHQQGHAAQRAASRDTHRRIVLSALACALALGGAASALGQVRPNGASPAGATEDKWFLMDGTKIPDKSVEEMPPLRIDFKEVELMKVIESLGALTGKIFQIEKGVGRETVTILSYDTFPAHMAYELLEAILLANKYEMVHRLDDQIIYIRPIATTSAGRPIVTPGQEIPGRFDNFVTYIVQLNYASVDNIKPLLESFRTENGTINGYAPTNTLVLTDTAEGVRQMLRVIEQIDLPGYQTVQDIFPLEFTRAEVLATQLQDVLMGAEGAEPTARPGAPARPTVQAPQVRRVTTARPQTEGEVFGSREQVFRVVSDERLNALIVVASAPLMDQVRDLIDKLDRPTPYEANNMRLYALQNADAEQVAEVLSASASTAPREGAAQGAQATGEVQPFEKKVQITAYPQTNSLLIIASPQDYKLLEELIAQLDVPQRQVHVEAIIMDVNINDNYQLSVELAGLSANDAVALSNITQLANLLVNGPLAAAAQGMTGGSLAIIDGTTEILVPDAATGALTTTTIPNVPFLMTALESMTHVDILSQPSLTTVDNEESNLIVGQNVPFVSGGTRQADISSVGSNFFSTRVEREDVGIKLKVTPQISEGDYVSLTIEVEVSQTTSNPEAGDPNIVGPTLQKSNITTKMVVKDGHTGVMGGLISETTNRSRSQVPLLGDLPLVGWVFGGKNSGRLKRNLVVLITPYIVRESPEYARLTEKRINEFRAANLDVLFERGLIKKIKKKHNVRSRYAPSEQRLETLQNAERFNKGTVEGQ